MSNATLALRELPHSINDWAAYSTETHPFDFSGYNGDVNIDNEGSIKLERAAARFDFRDASPLGDFRYHVTYDIAITDDMTPAEIEAANPLIDIQLSTMSLVNVDKTFYALRRVSNTGSPVPSANNPVLLCRPEKKWKYENGTYSEGNYVVDASYEWKKRTAQTLAGSLIPADVNYSGHFFYPFLTNDGKIDNLTNTGEEEDYNDSRWFTERCAKVVEGTEDNKESWNSDATYSTYHIWTYVAENTIAGRDDQINGISTGVVFKGKMVSAKETATNTNIDDDTKALLAAIDNKNANFGNADTAPVIYEFGGNLYLTWPKIRQAALAAALANTEIKWIPDETTADPNDGHWEIVGTIDRNNSLYLAVFGTDAGTGGFGSFEFTYTMHEVDADGKPTGKTEGPFTGLITDNIPENQGCANVAWEKWNANKNTANKAAYQEAVTAGNITIYQRGYDPTDGWGYYCYYYYWNRHNDNGRNGEMGPMEFAVVRNNVYKLGVTSIKRLGHPRISANDPNRPYGGTKDEDENVYITVTAEVLPWVVRLNNIEF